MIHRAPLLKGTLNRRYKRFLADITLADGTVLTAHCPNTGSMESCGSLGDVVYVSAHDDPKRKLAYTWEFTECKSGGLIGVNTGIPNAVVAEAILQQQIPELSGYQHLRREVKFGHNSRVDLLLSNQNADALCYVEIKNVTLLRDKALLFPDAKSERALKHIKELCEVVKQGHRGVMFFFVNRPDGCYFRPAFEIHYEYAQALEEAAAQGLEILVYRAQSDLNGITIGEKVLYQKGM